MRCRTSPLRRPAREGADIEPTNHAIVQQDVVSVARRSDEERAHHRGAPPFPRPGRETRRVNTARHLRVEVKREQGEDYWLDPAQIRAEQAESKRREKYLLKNKKDGYSEAKLREEIVAPYKNNFIGATVIGIGIIAVVFSQFPGLLELNEPASIASFPSEL